MIRRDRRYEDDALRCRGCGYELTGLRIGDKCPECAARIQTSVPPLPRNGHAVGALVLGALSALGLPAFHGLPSLALGLCGLVMGWRGLDLARDGRASAGSVGLAQSGLAASWVGVCMGGLVTLIWAIGHL